jgi:hypothetical protein
MDTTVIHALPGRIRVHLPDASAPGRDDVLALLEGALGLRSARLNTVTGNVLIRYDTALTDAAAILFVLQRAPAASPAVTKNSVTTLPSLWTSVPLPDPGRVVLPMLHLVYSCSPIGATMHAGELAWAIGRSAGRARTAMPALHLVLSCHPLGVILHVGELLWVLAPFLAPSGPQRASRASVLG